MKRIAILLASVMAVFALAACSSEPATLESAMNADTEAMEQIENLERQTISDSAGVFSDAQIEFKENTMIFTVTLSSEIPAGSVTGAEIEEMFAEDDSIRTELDGIAEELGVEPSKVSAQIIFIDSDGSELSNFTI